MSEAAKIKYITKTVRFGGKELTLYSIDGTTWSTRRSELMSVKERHEAQRVTMNDIKGISSEEESNEGKEEKEEESSSDEPFELKVNNDDVDDGDESDASESVKAK